MSQALNAWMNGELVRRWRVDRGSHRFRYDPSWPLSPRARALSSQNGGARVWDAMLALLDRVDAALNAVEAMLPDGFPDRTWDAIAMGMRGEHARYQQERAD